LIVFCSIATVDCCGGGGAVLLLVLPSVFFLSSFTTRIVLSTITEEQFE